MCVDSWDRGRLKLELVTQPKALHCTQLSHCSWPVLPVTASLPQAGRAKKVKSALLKVVQTTLGQLPAMLSAEQANASSNALQLMASPTDGSSMQEQMMMNAAVMGTLAATDMNVNGGIAETGGVVDTNPSDTAFFS